MTLPDHIDTGFKSELFEHATKNQKVMYVPGEVFYPDGRKSSGMRLSFGVQNLEGIELGMKRLAQSVKTVF